MTNLRRVTAVGAGIVAFLVPATVAHSLWTSSATATLTVTVPAASPTPTPSVPPALTAPVLECDGAEPQGYRVRWNATGVGDSYKVLRSSDGSTFQPVASVTEPTYTQNLAKRETWYLQVQAVRGSSESAPSNTLQLERRGNSENVSCKATP